MPYRITAIYHFTQISGEPNTDQRLVEVFNHVWIVTDWGMTQCSDSSPRLPKILSEIFPDNKYGISA